jgi:pimeloyl-ACP methyl ester carboxylesterase
MNEVEVRGLRIAYQRVGQGLPLVLLHGALGDSRDWRPPLDALSDEFTVVAWDVPGCGRSSDPPETFGLPDYADCLAGFVDTLGLQRPHVLGLSWGGGLALALYRRSPALPRTLVLVSAYAGWAGSLPSEIVAEWLDSFLRDAELPPAQVAAGFVPSLLTAAAPPEMVDEVVAIMSKFHPVGARVMVHRGRPTRRPAHHRGSDAAGVGRVGCAVPAADGHGDAVPDPGIETRRDPGRRAPVQRRGRRPFTAGFTAHVREFSDRTGTEASGSPATWDACRGSRSDAAAPSRPDSPMPRRAAVRSVEPWLPLLPTSPPTFPTRSAPCERVGTCSAA